MQPKRLGGSLNVKTCAVAEVLKQVFELVVRQMGHLKEAQGFDHLLPCRTAFGAAQVPVDVSPFVR